MASTKTAQTTGYTFTKGSMGSRVPSNTIIYSDTSCLRTIYSGVDTSSEIQSSTGTTKEEATAKAKELSSSIADVKKKAQQEERDDWNEIQTALENWKAAIRTYNDIIAERDMTRAEFYKGTITYEEDSFYSTIKNNDGTTTIMKEIVIEVLNNQITAQQQKIDELAEAKDKAQESYENKWGKNKEGITSSKSVQAPSAIVREQEKLQAELTKLETDLSNATKTQTASASVISWFDAMDKYVDSLSQFSENTSTLYAVEYKDDWWFYTGTTAIPDPKLNEFLRKFKRKQCTHINNLVQNVTAWSNTHLNHISTRVKGISWLISIWKTVSGGISINNVVSVVTDFIKGFYNWAYTIYKQSMTIMETLVIRVPQLTSKLITKLAEFDCNIETSSVSIKVSDPNANNTNTLV